MGENNYLVSSGLFDKTFCQCRVEIWLFIYLFIFDFTHKYNKCDSYYLVTTVASENEWCGERSEETKTPTALLLRKGSGYTRLYL